MPLTTKRRELKNARIYFIPVGTVVDGITVSKTTWPDNAPLTNWTDNQFAHIETVTEEKQFDSEIFKIPADAGGYFDDEEQQKKKRLWSCVSALTNSLLKQLEHGLATPPVVGTAQAPNVNNNNFIEGVFLLEIQIASTGVITERTQVWSYLRLTTAGGVGPTTAKPEFTFEQRDSGNNTYLLVA